MSADSQWPRFEVFQQSREGTPFQNVGSVHAPDGEMALLNARDVFVRRPQTANLWVVPAEVILSRTREELAANPAGSALEAVEGETQRYHVFNKTSQRRSMTYVTHCGHVEATTAHHALQQALQQFGDRESFVWWIVPAAAIVENRPEDAESMFAPAHDKTFRLPGAYHTRSLMEEIRQAQTDSDDESYS